MNSVWFGRIFAIMFFIVGCFFMVRASANPVWSNGREHPHTANILTIEECVQKIEFHKGESTRLFEEMKDHVWWLPQLEDRQKARRVFNLIVPMVSVAGVTGKVVATLLTLFGNYGIDCMDEWDWIENKCNWLEYHVDQAEFYERYLIHSARLLYVPDSGV